MVNDIQTEPLITAHVLMLIAEIKIKHPFLRIAQIVSNAAAIAGEEYETDVFYLKDEQLVEGLQKLLEEGE